MYTEPCGCKCSDSAWIEMCGPHRKETDEISARWKREREQGLPPPTIYRKNGVVQNVAPAPEPTPEILSEDPMDIIGSVL